MALPLYLAMTAAEIHNSSILPGLPGYMACHFSPYGTGLSNLPKTLPENTMLILNDRTPIHGHNRVQILEELEILVTQLHCSCVLLDLQRSGCHETEALARLLSAALPCPIGISECYAADLDCPVFLPPVPPDVPLPEYLKPWDGREIWLEAALGGTEIILTEQGYASTPLLHPDSTRGIPDHNLHCHYHINAEDDSAKFTLFRTRPDLDELLTDADTLGVTLAVGLWQELSGQREAPA